MKYYPAIFVLEPFHKEFLISLLIGKFLYLLQLILKPKIRKQSQWQSQLQ